MNAPVRFAENPTLATGRISPVLWALGILSVAMLFAGDLMNLQGGGRIAGNAYWGRDFVNVWTGGHLVRSGDIGTIYDIDAYQRFQPALFPGIGPHNYSYPPLSFPIAAFFSLLPYPLALTAWLGGTGALFVHACRGFWPAGAGTRWLVLLTPAALLNIWAGHYGFLVGALFLLGWQRLDRQPVQAGILFGCMLLKPHLAALVPIALLARGEWRALFAGAATVAVLVGTTSLMFGWTSWHEFLFDVGTNQSTMIDAGRSFYGLMSTSTATAVLRWTELKPLAALMQGLVTLAAAALVFLAARRRVPTGQLALLTATCTFLALPYAFNYDMVVVMVAALVAMLAAEAPIQRFAAGLALLCPAFGMLAAYWDIPLIPLALGALAWTQWRQATGRNQPISFNKQSAAVA